MINFFEINTNFKCFRRDQLIAVQKKVNSIWQLVWKCLTHLNPFDRHPNSKWFQTLWLETFGLKFGPDSHFFPNQSWTYLTMTLEPVSLWDIHRYCVYFQCRSTLEWQWSAMKSKDPSQTKENSWLSSPLSLSHRSNEKKN